MRNMPKEVSCYGTSLIIKHAIQRDFNKRVLFEGVENSADLLQNRHEWITMDLWIQLMKNFELAGGDLFKAGAEIAKEQVTHFQLFFLQVASIPFIIAKISGFFEAAICNAVSIKVDQKSKGSLDIIFTPKNGFKYSSQACDFDRGCTFGTLQLKRLRNLQFSEITCAARSDAPECRYRATWTPDPPLLDRFKSFFYFHFRTQKAILGHMEENYTRLEDQYKEIAGIKDFYSHIMANMSEGIAWLDDDLKISFVNKGFLSLVRCSDDETGFFGRGFMTFLANDTAQALGSELFSQCREKPKSAETTELLYKASDGAERLGQTTCLWVESPQQKPGFLLSIRDITEKRDIERKLYAVENRYRSLYENSPAMIIGVDKSGYILYANPAMEEQSGYGEKELKKMHYSDLVVPSGSNADDRLLEQRLGKVGLQEMHYKTKSGDWKSVALATFPLFDENWETIGPRRHRCRRYGNQAAK